MEEEALRATAPHDAARGIEQGQQEARRQHSHHHQQQNQNQKRQHRKNKSQQHHPTSQHKQSGSRRARKFKQPRTVDMPRILSEILREPKQALLHRVVRIVGPRMAWDLLKETMRLEQQGGQEVNAFGSGVPERFLVQDDETQEKKPRKRTTGGVYFTLLKDRVPKETYRDIYEIENKKKKAVKKRVRYEKKQKFEKELLQLGFDDLNVEKGVSGDSGARGDSRSGAVSVYPFAVPATDSRASSSSEVRVAPESFDAGGFASAAGFPSVFGVYRSENGGGDDDGSEQEDGEVEEMVLT